MKKIVLSLVAVAALWSCSGDKASKAADDMKNAATETVKKVEKTVMNVSTTESFISWKGTKVTGSHNGMISLQDIDMSKTDNGYTLNAVIDMNSITVLDIEDAESNGKLVGHLKSEDFFDVAQFPEANIMIKDAKLEAGKRVDVEGMLTIKGITNPETVSMAMIETPKGNFLMGETTINRTDYKVVYGSGSFFENLGDKLIHDDFNVKFNIKL